MKTSARRITAMAALATVGGVVGALVVAAPAFAATYDVTNGASSGAGSFKQAILNANANPGADTIAFDFLVPTTELTLTEALPVITETVNITGPGRTALTVNTAGGTAGLEVTGDTVQLTISGITFETTAPDANVGIALNEANFVANDLHVRGYPASGLVGDDANVVATDSLFTDNGDVGISWHGDNTDAELEGLSLQRVDLTNNSYGAFLTTNGTTGGITFAQVEASRNIFDGVQIAGTDFGPILFDGGQYNENTNGIDLDLDGVSEQNLVFIQNGTQISNNDGTGLVADLDSTQGLLVIGATITGNGVVSPQEGGGIRYVGEETGLLVQGSTVSNNAATAGGGVYVSSLVGPGAVLNISASDVENNTASSANLALGRGGGVYIGTINGSLGTTGGFAVTEGSSISHNTAQRDGGGIYVDHFGNGVDFDGGFLLQGSTIDDNHATEGDGGGIHFAEFSNTSGLDNPFIGVLFSTISRNTATNGFGGAFFFDKAGHSGSNVTEVFIEDSTISGNDADLGGAGYLLGNPGDDDVALTLRLSTIVNNSSGLFIDNGEIAVDANNSIIAKNGAQDLTLNPASVALLDVTYSNVLSVDPDIKAAIAAQTGNQLGQDPKLGPLTNNGGSTETHVPLVGSPIWDAGDPAFDNHPDTDQRGEARVIMRVDMGSTETPRLLAATGGELDPIVPLGGGLLLLAGLALVVTRRLAA